MSALQRFLSSPAGKSVAIGLVLVAAVALVYSIVHNLGPSEAQSLSENVLFVDSATGKGFMHKIKRGESVPIDAPSGKKTGYPAEKCFWTKDGKTKKEPTAVLMNNSMGKPGPTFCPDCGRLVRNYNPAPTPGATPPPTKEEYERNKSDRPPQGVDREQSGG